MAFSSAGGRTSGAQQLVALVTELAQPGPDLAPVGRNLGGVADSAAVETLSDAPDGRVDAGVAQLAGQVRIGAAVVEQVGIRAAVDDSDVETAAAAAGKARVAWQRGRF